jgi:hypothetical protein
MSEQPITPASEATKPAPEAPTPTEPAAAAPEAPPWGEDFDAEKAWKLVQNLRSDKETLSKRETLTPEQKAKLAEYDKVLESQKTAEQKAQDALAAAEKRAESLIQRSVSAEIKALAADGFADPADAAVFLGDLTKYASGDDVDTASIKADLADLLARKPHLGKSPENRTPAPNPAQGTSAGGSPTPSQLTETDVQRMYAAKDYDGIEKARQEGRLNTVLGIKP